VRCTSIAAFLLECIFCLSYNSTLRLLISSDWKFYWTSANLQFCRCISAAAASCQSLRWAATNWNDA
jgi:hypothetical protein